MGIDIRAGGNRPGGVPTHVTSAPKPAANLPTIAQLHAAQTNVGKVIDPIGAWTRFRRAIGRRLTS